LTCNSTILTGKRRREHALAHLGARQIELRPSLVERGLSELDLDIARRIEGVQALLGLELLAEGIHLGIGHLHPGLEFAAIEHHQGGPLTDRAAEFTPRRLTLPHDLGHHRGLLLGDQQHAGCVGIRARAGVRGGLCERTGSGACERQSRQGTARPVTEPAN
jgi:hypothetical protein